MRFSASVLLAAAVLAAGCKKKNEDTASTTGSAAGSGSATVVATGSAGSAGSADMAGSAAGSGSAAAAAGSAATVASKNPPPKIGTGDPASLAALSAIKLPTPKGVPANAAWKDVAGGEDGDRRSNLKTPKDDILLAVRFLDCRQTVLKDYVNKKPDDRGDLGCCFDAPTGELKGFDLIAPPDAEQHAVRAGNVCILASGGPNWVKESVKKADLDAFLETIDLAAVAKL